MIRRHELGTNTLKVKRGVVCECSDNPGTVVKGSRVCISALFYKTLPLVLFLYSSYALYQHLKLGPRRPSQHTARGGFYWPLKKTTQAQGVNRRS